MDRTARLIELIEKRLALAFFESRRCMRTLFRDTDSFENEQKALIYLNRAARHMDLAFSIYQNNLEEIEHYAINLIFDAFDIFYNEVTENVATNHSHQWSDIQYRRYKETLNDLVPESREED